MCSRTRYHIQPQVAEIWATPGQQRESRLQGTYSCDRMDLLLTKATPEGTLNYTYHAAGDVASMSSSNANGVSVGYTYDSLTRLSTQVRLSFKNYSLPFHRLIFHRWKTLHSFAGEEVSGASYPNTPQSTC